MNSIAYYDRNAETYAEDTRKIDMSRHHKVFESYLEKGNHILDLGCGSGRDSHHFMSRGYQVTSMDGSAEMVKQASSYLSRPVIHSTFEDYESNHIYDGIWASASLLHVSKENLADILSKYIDMLNINGVFFMSYKIYDEDFEYDGRRFTCFTLDSLTSLLSTFDNISVVNIRETDSVQTNNMRWVSAIIRRER